MSKCVACMYEGDDFIKIRQVGVNNYVINGEIKEPEIYFKILICPLCGNLQVDKDTIQTKIVTGIWG
jgi:hypothetical protein